MSRVQYIAYTEVPYFVANGQEGEFSTWEEFAAANPGADSAEVKRAMVKCDGCWRSMACDVVSDLNPRSPLSASDAVSLVLSPACVARYYRTGPLTVRCWACEEADLFRQCVELAPDFCLRSDWDPSIGIKGEWDLRASWVGPDGGLSEAWPRGLGMVGLLLECRARLHHERAWLLSQVFHEA